MRLTLAAGDTASVGSAAGKSVVAGVAQRKGRIIALKVSNAQAVTLLPIIREKVLPQSIVYTDELPSYDRVGAMGYHYRRIHHASKVYVVGDAHTNTVEGFWSLFKRSVSGVYHAVSEKYLQCYLDKYSFRYNHRLDEASMFQAVLNRI